MLLEQFQNSTGFNIKHKHECPFPSHIGSSIPTFRDMYLQLLVRTNFNNFYVNFTKTNTPTWVFVTTQY